MVSVAATVAAAVLMAGGHVGVLGGLNSLARLLRMVPGIPAIRRIRADHLVKISSSRRAEPGVCAVPHRGHFVVEWGTAGIILARTAWAGLQRLLGVRLVAAV